MVKRNDPGRRETLRSPVRKETSGAASDVKSDIPILTVIVACAALGASVSDPAVHGALLGLALAGAFVHWYLARARKQQSNGRRARLATMRNISQEAALLRCSETAARHPNFGSELRIFERAVLETMADIHRRRAARAPLSLVQHYVREAVPAAVRAVEAYDDALTLERACLDVRRMSMRLLEGPLRSPSTAAPAPETVPVWRRMAGPADATASREKSTAALTA